MTRKDYVMIANNIKSISNWENISPTTALLIACMFAEDLQADNPRFDRQIFFSACGV
jgi:hypothetical protein